jgi:hypothetical protein
MKNNILLIVIGLLTICLIYDRIQLSKQIHIRNINALANLNNQAEFTEAINKLNGAVNYLLQQDKILNPNTQVK